MGKRNKRRLTLAVLLLVMLLPLSACVRQPAAEPPYFTAVCGAKIMVPGNLYRLTNAEHILISAVHPSGIASIAYRFGDGDLMHAASDGSLLLDLPQDFAGKGIFSLNVYVTARDGNQSPWAQYLLTTTTVPELSLYDGDKLLTPDQEYPFTPGHALTYTAEHPQGVQEVAYRLGEQELQTVSGSEGEIAVPEDFIQKGRFSLNIQVTAADGARSPWRQYLFAVE
ncbi:MAG: hypothetical protein K6B40_04495 [Firmicutes bacterium]|nr:hypothetical protein [Bacillota bacterium]